MFGDSEFVNKTFMLDTDHLLSAEKNSRVKHITVGLASGTGRLSLSRRL